MMPADASRVVRVEAPARVHFGMLDLRGDLGRRFGGIGAAVPAPSLCLEATTAFTLTAEGPSSERVLAFARRYLEAEGITGGAHLRVERDIPPHAGLGSGTQLALATARALAELYARDTGAPVLARAVGRARRSAIGTWIFAYGGFVLEGGRRASTDGPAPLLARYAFPPSWRCVLVVPRGEPGVSGDAESAAFAELPRPSEMDVARVARLVLMALLPSVLEDDIQTFGHALTEIQHINGRWFAPAQGGAFAPGASEDLVRRMREWGAPGVGQSSWGPAVYAVVTGDAAASALAARVRDVVGHRGNVYVSPFANEGARVR